VAWKRLPKRLQHGEEASLVEHLGELRARLVIALGAIAVAFIVAFAFHKHLLDWLTRPLPDDKELLTLSVTEPFFTAVKVSMYAGFALALPVVLYQLWSFLAPAMQENSQRIVSVFVAIATVLFAAGVAFGYFVVLPRALSFLVNFDEQFFNTQVRASYYFSFVSLALIGMALVFEMPIFILALVRLRILTADRLRSNRRMGILIVVVVAVLLPTVDPVSLFFETVPLLILFEASIWLSVLLERRWERGSADDWATSEY
jgi:sec-independent protein translocase protein TatC